MDCVYFVLVICELYVVEFVSFRKFDCLVRVTNLGRLFGYLLRKRRNGIHLVACRSLVAIRNF